MVGEGDQTQGQSSLDALLKANLAAAKQILAEPTPEEKEKTRIAELDGKLRELVGQEDLRTILSAYAKKTSQPAEAALIKGAPNPARSEEVISTLTINHEGKLFMHTSPDLRNAQEIELVAINSSGEYQNGFGLNTKLAQGALPSDHEAIVDGKAFVTPTNDLLTNILRTWKSGGFPEATAQSVEQTLVADLTGKVAELNPTGPPAPPAAPPPGAPPAPPTT